VFSFSLSLSLSLIPRIYNQKHNVSGQGVNVYDLLSHIHNSQTHKCVRFSRINAQISNVCVHNTHTHTHTYHILGGIFRFFFRGLCGCEFVRVFKLRLLFHVCVCVCVCARKYVHAFACASVLENMRVCNSTWYIMYIYMYIYTHTHTHILTYLHVDIFTCMYMHVCPKIFSTPHKKIITKSPKMHLGGGNAVCSSHSQENSSNIHMNMIHLYKKKTKGAAWTCVRVGRSSDARTMPPPARCPARPCLPLSVLIFN